MSRWMKIAWTQVGTAEVAGPQANPQIIAYFARIGRADVLSDETAWCGGFAGFCLATAEVSLDAIPSSERLLARSYAAIGTPIDTPRTGALVVLTRPGGGPGAGHVGFVAGVTATHVLVLGGNQANAVNVTPFPLERIVALRWPEAVTPAELDARGSRITTTARGVQNQGLKATALEAMSHAFPREIPPGIGKAASQASQAMGLFETFAAFGAFAWSKAPALLAIAGVYLIFRMVVDAGLVRQFRAEDASTGAHQGRPADAGDAVD